MDDGVHTLRTTQAAEGLPRWRWTTAELLKLADMGAFADTDRFELIGGEIVPMSPIGRQHQVLSQRIAHIWRDFVPPDAIMLTNEQFTVAEDTYTLPDLLLWPATILVPDLRGPDVLLLIEIANTSRDKDLGVKADVYARAEIADYWVIDANDLTIVVHREPVDGRYSKRVTFQPDDTVQSLRVPQLSLVAAELVR